MKYTIGLHPRARLELRDARDYYRILDEDLALDLLHEYRTKLEFIGDYPHAAPKLFGTYRHVVLGKFKYMIVYRVVMKTHTIRVLAIIHVHRDPKWIKQALTGRL